MGIALGAAFRGQRAIPEIQFSDFVWPSVNQLIGEAGPHLLRHQRSGCRCR